MPGFQPPPLPPDLPEPTGDGATDHLRDARVTPVRLPATSDEAVVLGALPRLTLLFCYPRMGQPLVSDWDRIPGARGCTPEACGFRDVHAEFAAADVDVYGVSTQELAAQREAVERLALPFALLSDADLALATAWKLPTFEVAGHTLLKRLTLLLHDRAVTRLWYPVFPPDRHAADVLDALRTRGLMSTAEKAM